MISWGAFRSWAMPTTPRPLMVDSTWPLLRAHGSNLADAPSFLRKQLASSWPCRASTTWWHQRTYDWGDSGNPPPPTLPQSDKFMEWGTFDAARALCCKMSDVYSEFWCFWCEVYSEERVAACSGSSCMLSSWCAWCTGADTCAYIYIHTYMRIRHL